MSDDRVEVKLDDENPLLPCPLPGTKRRTGARLVVNRDDLLSESDRSRPVSPRADAAGSRIDPWGVAPISRRERPGSNSRRSAGQAGLHGLSAGLIAWGVSEMSSLHGAVAGRTDDTLTSGPWMPLCFAILGCCLCAAEHIVELDWRKAARRGAVGLGFGALGGILSGWIGHTAISALDRLHASGPLAFIPVAAVAWAVAGAFVGLAQRLGSARRARLAAGLIGGALGGIAGGLLINPVFAVFGSDTAARGAAIVLMGITTGAAIQWANEKRRDAWLTISQGPMAGTQYELLDPRTRIGSSARCEIVIENDPELLPEHAVIETAGAERTLHNVTLGALPIVNGRPVSSARLEPGDVITIGSIRLVYQKRARAHTPISG